VRFNSLHLATFIPVLISCVHLRIRLQRIPDYRIKGIVATESRTAEELLTARGEGGAHCFCHQRCTMRRGFWPSRHMLEGAQIMWAYVSWILCLNCSLLAHLILNTRSVSFLFEGCQRELTHMNTHLCLLQF
jgi:hypothetical protein